jgi:hypothetical protein
MGEYRQDSNITDIIQISTTCNSPMEIIPHAIVPPKPASVFSYSHLPHHPSITPYARATLVSVLPPMPQELKVEHARSTSEASKETAAPTNSQVNSDVCTIHLSPSSSFPYSRT